MRASTALLWLGLRISISLLWVRRSNCSRESLYLWTARRMVTTSFLVGSGMGPETLAPLRLAVSDDLFRALIDELVIVSLQPDADHFLVCHFGVSSLKTYSVMLSLGTVENLYPLGRVYHSAPQKKADMCRPNIRNAAIYSRKPPADRGSQPPDDRTYSAEVTVFPRNLPLHRILRLFLLNTRSIIIQDLPPVVKAIFYFFNKFLKLFSVKMLSVPPPHIPPPRSPRHPRILMDRPGEIRSRLIARSVSPILLIV